MKNQRHSEIIKILAEGHIIKTHDLVEKFHVSAETIRRDLDYLEKKGYLTKIYGGAIPKSMNGMEPEYAYRKIKNKDKKITIAKKAAQLVENGDTLIIDSGTTTLQLAKFLHAYKQLTVFTNSLLIGSELVKNPDIKVIMLGGDLRPGELSTSGFLAENSLSLFYVDKVFLGAGGFTLRYGISDYHIEETNLKRLYITHSQKVIVLADNSKFEQITLNHVCNLEDIDIIITDSQTDKKLISELKRQEIHVIIADEKISTL